MTISSKPTIALLLALCVCGCKSKHVPVKDEPAQSNRYIFEIPRTQHDANIAVMSKCPEGGVCIPVGSQAGLDALKDAIRTATHGDTQKGTVFFVLGQPEVTTINQTSTGDCGANVVSVKGDVNITCEEKAKP